MNAQPYRPTLAVWKLASCDGCQLTLLDCEDDLLEIAGAVTIAHFPEATSNKQPGPYDISLVEGSVANPATAALVQQIRSESKVVVAIGACATSGGVQALRNFADVEAYKSSVYPYPEWIEATPDCLPVSSFVKVDYELRGCPISAKQLLEFLRAVLSGEKPRFPTYSVCTECKLRGVTCLAVSRGESCMGPITQAGCGALCPGFNRGCYGCFGPCEEANVEAYKKLAGAHDAVRRLKMIVTNFETPKGATQ